MPRGYRSGYWHYDPYWCDDDFWFGWYVFNPYQYRCVASPWYYYPHLPGYLNYSCVRVVQISLLPWGGSYYDYRPSRYGSGYYRDSDLDDAIDDLVRAFEDSDRRALGRLVPRRGDVSIFVDGAYQYSMDSERFYDLMQDNVYATRTRRYEIVRVETWRDEAEVTARHEFTDAWGQRTSVYHWYRLSRDSRGYVITRFGTSDRRGW